MCLEHLYLSKASTKRLEDCDTAHSVCEETTNHNVIKAG